MHVLMLFSDYADILKYLNSAGVLGVLILAIIGGYRRWWVYGWLYKQMEQERDDWRNLALHGTKIAEQTVDLFRRGRKNND